VNVTDISRDHVAEAIARMEMDIKTVARSHKGLSSGHLKLLRELQSLTAENAALREKVDDWENAVAHARDNRSDEQHCTCVPPLLWKMKQLERKYAALEKLIIKVGYIITTFNGEMALCRDPWHQPKEAQP
jgi:regulator of replication initiation timing